MQVCKRCNSCFKIYCKSSMHNEIMDRLNNCELEQINGGAFILKALGILAGAAVFAISVLYGFLFPSK